MSGFEPFLEAISPARLRERIAAVIEACGTPLGYAQRGVASWETDRLLQWMEREPLVLTARELNALAEIEQQVFGNG